VDEADNLHGNYDRGGAGKITEVVKSADQPVVLIANDFYEMSRGLRNACREIEFRDVSARSIVPVLRDVCRREGVEFEDEALQRIAEVDDGDLRSAIRDLQAAAEGRSRVTVEDVVTGERDRTIGVFAFLDAVLKEEGAEDALGSAYATDETPDDLVKWVEHNLPAVYEGVELAQAYEHLANADRWLGRVRATQNYSYWRYTTDNLAAGVAAARDGTKGGWTRFGRPQFWSSRSDTAEHVVRAIAESHGTDMATARREVFPFLAAMTHHCKPRELTVRMAAHYDLDAEHVAFVTGSGESTNKVESIVEDARARRDAEIEEHAGGAFAPSVGRDGEDEATDTTGDEEGDAASAGDDGASAADGDAAATADDGDDRSGGASDDDGQSGLSDFM
jgi:replication factor C large subunit